MVPFIDLQRQYATIRSEIRAAIDHVLDTGEYVLGSEVQALEEEFAAYCGARHAVALNSGTSALHLALLAVGIKPGDEVITSPFSFIATASVIDYCGAVPVFVDIHPDTYTLDPAQLQQAITPRTRAILPVHLYGHPAAMQEIQAIAHQHGLAVIEDAAQAHGAEYQGRRMGALGLAGCFSFYPTKNMGAYGEGGMLVTDHAHIADSVRLLRNWGQTRKYVHERKGYNYRMEGLQGAILRVKLRHLESWTEARRALAQCYDKLLESLPVTRPVELPGNRHVYHTYTIRSLQRDRLQQQLQAAGIGTAVHYATPIHLQPAFQELGYLPGSLPHAEQAAQEVLSLPLFAELTVEEVERVGEAIRNSLGDVH